MNCKQWCLDRRLVSLVCASGGLVAAVVLRLVAVITMCAVKLLAGVRLELPIQGGDEFTIRYFRSRIRYSKSPQENQVFGEKHL